MRVSSTSLLLLLPAVATASWFDDAWDHVGSAFGQANDKVQDQATSVANQATSVRDQVAGQATSARKEAGKQAGHAWGQANHAATKAWKSAGSAATDAWDQAQDAAESVRDKAGKTAESVRDQAGKAADSAADQLRFSAPSFDEDDACPDLVVRCLKNGKITENVGDIGKQSFCKGKGLKCEQCHSKKNTAQCNLKYPIDCAGQCVAQGSPI